MAAGWQSVGYTLELHYDRAEENAQALAAYLAGLAGVTRVLYPTRSDQPDHNRAINLLVRWGGHTVSFEVAGGRAAANKLTRAAPQSRLPPTLGAIATPRAHLAGSSHRSPTSEARAALGISEGYFRVCVGVEDIGLLCAGFEVAIAASQTQ